MDDSLEISVSMGTDDYKVIRAVINPNIDSRLEGFTKSEFVQNGGRLGVTIHPEEVQIFIRRLWEMAENGNESAYDWEDDILRYYYGIIPKWD